MTIEARSAIASVGGVEQRLLDRQAGGKMARHRIDLRAPGRRGRRPGARRPARAAVANRSAARRSCSGKPPFGRALHRVDEVVGDVDPVERLAEAGAADGVADDDVVEQDAGGSDPLGRAGESAHGVPAACSRGTSAAPT